MLLDGYNREQAIARMDYLSENRRPFIFIINYEQDLSYIEEIDKLDSSQILYDLNGFTNCNSLMQSCDKADIRWQSFPMPLHQYQHSFEYVLKNILSGNSFLTNLTCVTPIETNLSLKDIFLRSKAMYRLWFKDQFVVFSPEIFIRIHKRKISTFPMKGTINALIPFAEKQLLNDPKETAEHATIVDLMRNDLSMVAGDVCVLRYRYVDELETNSGPIIQTSSEIGGILPEEYCSKVGEILFKLLPAGSITGAPKCKTMDVIAHAENYKRGFYTGVMGYSDGEILDSAVMIRFIEQTSEGKFVFKSGGGITCKSDMKSEYNEMIKKVYVPIY